jgi:hypothetical protein
MKFLRWLSERNMLFQGSSPEIISVPAGLSALAFRVLHLLSYGSSFLRMSLIDCYVTVRNMVFPETILIEEKTILTAPHFR